MSATPALLPAYARPADTNNPLRSLGVVCVIFYTFLVFSRFSELLIAKTGVNLYIMPLVMFISLAAAALNGVFNVLLAEKPLRWYLLLYLWLFLTMPFSIWKGGSLTGLIYWCRMGLICLAIVGLLDTVEDCRKAMVAVTAALIVVLFTGFTAMPSGDEERFAFDAGTLANANEFANHIMFSLPFCSMLFAKRSKLALKRFTYVVLLLGTVTLLVKTGSRGGMAIAAVLALLVFFSARFIHKLKLLIVGVVLAIVVIVATPQSALQRYRTIFSDQGTQEAVQSRETRLELLKASLRVTAKHPLFGVGLGNFVVAYNDERSDAGLAGHWEATHNAYTQMSADTGIPSLVFYLGAIFSAFVAIRKIRKETKKLPAFHVAYRASSVLMVATAAYVVSGLFTSNAHEFYLPALLGLSVAVSRAATRELAAYRALQQGTAPAVAEPSGFAATFRPRTRPFGRETALTRNN